jgi:hypothetical protein
MTNVIHLPSSTMDRLLCKLEEDIYETILKAVNIVGKNVVNDGHPIWLLNKEIAINQHGNLVNNIKQHGHLTEGNGVDILPGQNTKLMLYFHCPTKDSIQSVIF